MEKETVIQGGKGEIRYGIFPKTPNPIIVSYLNKLPDEEKYDMELLEEIKDFENAQVELGRS